MFFQILTVLLLVVLTVKLLSLTIDIDDIRSELSSLRSDLTSIQSYLYDMCDSADTLSPDDENDDTAAIPGQQSTVNGQQSTVNGQQSTDNGQHTYLITADVNVTDPDGSQGVIHFDRSEITVQTSTASTHTAFTDAILAHARAIYHCPDSTFTLGTLFRCDPK